MDYDKMSDDELSMELMKLLHGSKIVDYVKTPTGMHLCSSSGLGLYDKWIAVVDITNPFHIWPLIVDGGISVLSPLCTGGQWTAHSQTCETVHQSVDPLRAVVICYLKMVKGDE